MTQNIKTRNFVQKYLKRFCRATVEVDRKKESKKGYVKHKGDIDGETRSRWYDWTFWTLFW